MLKVVRPLIVFGGVSGSCLAAYALSGGALGGESRTPMAGLRGVVGYYDLSELELLETTLYHIEESYVDPERVDYDAMFVDALEAVEQRVPVTLFRREPGGRRLHLEVGTTQTTLEIPPIRTRKELQRALREVAQILATLSPSDIPFGDEDEGVPLAQIEYAMINGILGTLDPHSRLLPPEASKEMDVENQGEFGGLGITIVEREGRLTVEYPLPGTPAERADIRADDQIVRIDGESTINMSLDDAVSKLRGPVGSEVYIEILREGITEPLAVKITRAKIKINPVEGQLLDGAVGYAAIQGFHAQVEQDLTALLTRLDREAGGKMKGLVLDLRDNPGGYLNQAEAVADFFLKSGTIVSQVDSDGKKLESYEAKEDGSEPGYPIVILVNSSSASASEIVSGALRNNDRAVIIGERTYGKGSVQNLHQYFDGSKLKMTISQYLTPGDRSIQAVGIPADIELVPTVVERKKDEKTGEQEDLALLYYRERVRREGDADKHLEESPIKPEEPAYTLRYHRPAERRRRSSATLDLSKDLEVQFARDVVLSAKGTRRADLLSGAAPVVERYRKEGDKQISAAFQGLGIDWSSGTPVATADVAVRFDLGDDGVLTAGQAERVTLEVTNNGSQPLYRLSAIATFEGDYTPREFMFGKLAPGETRRYEQKVQLVLGHPTELSPVSFSFRDVGGKEVAVHHAQLPVQGNSLPQLDWNLSLSEAAPGGDGDGQIEVGERVMLGVEIRNTGKGATAEPFARIKNKSGRALDIAKGTLEPGVLRLADGSACDVASADCLRRLSPGESWKGDFEVVIKAVPKPGDPLRVSFELGDASAYDHASIIRQGHYEYFANRQEVILPIGVPHGGLPVGTTPRIEVTRAPAIVVEGDLATISGVITDDVGLAHIEVYHGSDKVFFQGSIPGARVRSVPFTADVKLEPGLNTFSVLATDSDGFTDTSAVVTFFLAPELGQRVGYAIPAGGVPLQRREN